MREFSSVGLNTGYLLFLVSLIFPAINMFGIIDKFSIMSENNVIQSSSAWPFVEIRKLLKERKIIFCHSLSFYNMLHLSTLFA